jgi:hypothetical protein
MGRLEELAWCSEFKSITFRQLGLNKPVFTTHHDELDLSKRDYKGDGLI